MKILYVAIAISMLVGVLMPTPVTAVGVTNISGIVTDDSTGYPIEDAELSFKNMRTLETVYAQTDEYGYYYKSLASFAQGWISGDGVTVTANADGFSQYTTVYSLESTWPSPNLDVYPRMTPKITNDDVQNPDWEMMYSIAYLCTGGSGVYNYGAINGYKYSPPNDAVYKPEAGTDGVNAQSYLRVQDDGSWVAPGRTYRVYGTSWMKIEKNIGQYVYYGDENGNALHIHLTDNSGNEYYDISRGSDVTIDPIHNALLPKGGVHGCDGLKLKITITYDIHVDDITGGGNSDFTSGTWSNVRYITYDWDA
jgi:hypothetical protein